jgi:hypothetical protein
MRKLAALGAAALLMLAVAVPLTAAGATTTPKTVTGSFLATYTGAGGEGAQPIVVRLEVRTDASGNVQFGYYQQDNLVDPSSSSVAVVDTVQFFRDSSGTKAARLNITECAAGYHEGDPFEHCNSNAVVIVTDGNPDTFCGGTPTEPCIWPFRVDKGNILINLGGQNGQ